ncbi:hypothetical protein GVN18_32590 [Pseudomonas sp. ODNR1LW]|nr:hypothetical protein [Pseudomonas sp. ODNR1LW]
MPLDFLTPRVERLSADGRWTVLNEGGALGRLRPTVVLIAREMTAFSLFEAAALPRSRRGQAARLHARTGSPYLESGHSLVWAGADCGVWWWDAARIAPLVKARFGAGRPEVRPESLAQPAGAGWRMVKLAQGYEAQRWRGGRLVASAWRRERFDMPAWTAFVRSQRGADDAPESPPPPQSLPLAYDAPAFRTSAADLSREQMIQAGVGALALASIGLSLFFVGQAQRLGSESEALEAEAVEIRAATPQTSSLAGLEINKRKLAAYAEIETQTNPLTATGAAIGIVAFHDLTPTALEAEGETLSLTLPYTSVPLVETLVSDLETSGYFYNVRPRTDAQGERLIIEMQVREAAPPLSAAG